MANSQDSGYTVPALARGLMIVEMFSRERRVLTTQDFAETLGVSPSSIYRIVQTLIDMGYLTKVARSAYELGPQVVSNGFSFLASRDLVDVAAPHLQRLRDRTSISCHLSIRDGRDTLYIYRALASQQLSVNIPIGTRLPCHINAMGRILLSSMSNDDLGRLYFDTQLDNYPKPQPQSLPELKERIRQDKEQGYAVNYSDSATAIASPILNFSGQIVGAINISGPDPIMQIQDQNLQVQDQLLQTAVAISKDLGYASTRLANRLYW